MTNETLRGSENQTKKRSVLYVGSDLSAATLDTFQTKGYNILQAKDANHSLNAPPQDYAAVIIDPSEKDYIRLSMLRSKLKDTLFLVFPNGINLASVVPNCYISNYCPPDNLTTLLESDEFVNSAKTPPSLTLKDLGTHVAQTVSNMYSSIVKNMIPQLPYRPFNNDSRVYVKAKR